MAEFNGTATVVENEIMVATADPTTEPHIVVNADRTVTVPEELRCIAVERDHNIETVTFDCPRYWDEHDLSAMRIYIHYRCADGEAKPYLCKNLVVDSVDSSIIHFDWTLSQDATCVKGPISFLVAAKKPDDTGTLKNYWHSRLNQEMSVLEGLECDTEELVEHYPDAIEQILLRVDASLPNIEVETATLTWDGDTTDRASLEIGGYTAYKVSNEILVPESVIGKTYSYYRTSSSDIYSSVEAITEAMISKDSLGGEAYTIGHWAYGIVIGPAGTYSIPKVGGGELLDITIPEDGVYFVVNNSTTNQYVHRLRYTRLAESGDIIVVEAVDSTGKVTKTKAVKAPTGGSAKVTAESIKNALGYTPADDEDVTKLSEAIVDLEDKIPSEVGGLTAAQISALDGMFKIASYTEDPTAAYSAFKVAFGLDESGGEVEPDEPENPDVTLTSIAVKYSGGDVDVGTELSDLTGIVVTATYSDGSTRAVSGYTLSGEIAEGVNIITVSYGGLTATFTVTGVAETVTYTVTNNLTNVTNSNTQTELTEGFYSATLNVVDGYSLESVVITMGGVDITESVYTAETGSILITEVTGDIVITATAAALAYVAMASADISTDSVKLYTDDATTALATKYYQKGRYSLNATESDAVVKVRLTNNTDAGISTSNVYVGSTNEQAIRNPNSSINVSYAVSGNKGTVAAGGSVEIEYTVRAGYWLYVCGYDSLTVEVIGVLDIHEIGETLATTSKEVGSFTVYSDDGTTQIAKFAYVNAYATTERFETDTDVRVTFVSQSPSSGDILMGCVESGTLTAKVLAYYGDWRVVKNFVTGAVISYEFTVKAGYYFAYAQGKNTTIYVEKV